jgi:hypothetical protein
LKKRDAILLTFLLATLGAVSMARAEVAQKGNIRVTFQGALSPRTLPRRGERPVKVSFAGAISAVRKNGPPPQLHKIEIAINRNGHINPGGLPRCGIDEIQPATTGDALEACGESLVGQGHFSAKVLLPGKSRYPSEGKLYAFNGSYEGHPAILAHIFGRRPVATSFTLPFVIAGRGGEFPTVLTATLPKGDQSFVTGINLTLSRTFESKGKKRGYVSAGCPAPPGVTVAAVPLVKAAYGFVGGQKVTSTLNRTCKAEG